MNERARPTLTISKDELRDTSIDEALEHQRAYVPAPVEAVEPKFRLIYSSWFYLLLAGAFGALLAWGVLEPAFVDVISVTGKVESVDADAVPTTFRGTVYEIRGRIRVGETDVFVLPEHTRVLGVASDSRLSIRELVPGQIVRASGGVAPDSTTLIAAAVRVVPDGTPVDGRVSLSSLELQQQVMGFFLFPIVAAIVGFTVGGVEGLICRTYARAAWSAAIGLIAGLVGGCVSVFAAGLVFVLLGSISSGDPTASAPAFLFQMFRRGLAWTIAGMSMGLGQGFALKSSTLKFNGFVGGMVGGLIGGLLFDPINLMLQGPDGTSGAELSRAVGLAIVGGSVGLLIGLTDLLTRDAWLKVLDGPLQGKEFSFNRTPIRLGSSPKNEIYLFKDPKIDPIHAEIHKLRDTYEIRDNSSSTGTFVNGQRVTRERLTDGARIRIGASEFSYSSRDKTSK
jgi:hypothetical protein